MQVFTQIKAIAGLSTRLGSALGDMPTEQITIKIHDLTADLQYANDPAEGTNLPEGDIGLK
ncbi:MAG: hypothetical protein Q9175_007275, partial [Cornicularia normoerica]